MWNMSEVLCCARCAVRPKRKGLPCSKSSRLIGAGCSIFRTILFESIVLYSSYGPIYFGEMIEEKNEDGVGVCCNYGNWTFDLNSLHESAETGQKLLPKSSIDVGEEGTNVA